VIFPTYIALKGRRFFEVLYKTPLKFYVFAVLVFYKWIMRKERKNIFLLRKIIKFVPNNTKTTKIYIVFFNFYVIISIKGLGGIDFSKRRR